MAKLLNINNFKLIWWSIVLYLFIFQPIVSKYIYLTIEIILVSIFILGHSRLFKDNIRLFKNEYLFMFLICGYSSLIDISHLNLVFFDRFVASFFQSYFVPFLFIYFISRSKFLQSHLSDCILCMCFIAGVITLLAIVEPSFSMFCMNHATEDSKDRFQELYVYGNFSHFRSYGLSESLNFTYAYVISVIGAYVLSTRFKLYTPFLLVLIIITIIFNARIAFVPILVSFFYLIFFNRGDSRNIRSFILTIAGFSLLSICMLKLYPSLYNEWGLSFFSDLTSTISGEGDGTLNTLTGSMWVVPDNAFDFIFGTGENLFHSRTSNSDVGYILQLNYGGLVLLILVLSYFVYISHRIFKVLSIHHWFTLIFIVSVFVLNFKGFYLAAIPGPRFLTFLYVYYIYSSRKQINSLNPLCPLM